MNLSIIAVLVILELILILMVACGYLIWRLRTRPVQKQLEHIENSTSWLDFIKQKSDDTLRRQGNASLDLSKTEDTESSDHGNNDSGINDDATGDEATSDEAIGNEAPDNEERALLQFRLQYLEIEKKAGETSDKDDPKFWESLLENMKSIATIASVDENNEQVEAPPVNTIPDEIERLREVIANQDEMIKKLKETLASIDKDDPALEELLHQIEQLEKFQSDAENCIGSLESENERLARALLQPDSQQKTAPSAPTGDGEHLSDIIQESVDDQENKIIELEKTIDNLKLEAEVAAKLKATLRSFTEQSKDMMHCIHTLEDENDSLKLKLKELEEFSDEEDAPDSDTIDQLNEKITELEQQLIKKDVDYVKLKESQPEE